MGLSFSGKKAKAKTKQDERPSSPSCVLGSKGYSQYYFL